MRILAKKTTAVAFSSSLVKTQLGGGLCNRPCEDRTLARRRLDEASLADTEPNDTRRLAVLPRDGIPTRRRLDGDDGVLKLAS